MKSRGHDPMPQTTIGGIAATPPSPPYRPNLLAGIGLWLRWRDFFPPYGFTIDGVRDMFQICLYIGLSEASNSRRIS